MHIGIDAGMNVGTFANVMMAVYLGWLSGEEIDAFWRYLMSDPSGKRPVRKGWRVVLIPLDRIRLREPKPKVVVLHHPSEASVRRAALLRLWDLGDRLEFQADPDVSAEQLSIRLPSDKDSRAGAKAGHALIRLLPGLWWMRGLRHIPGVSTAFGHSRYYV